MKSIVSPRMIALLVASAISPLSAQNLENSATTPVLLKADGTADVSSFQSNPLGKYDILEVKKAQGIPSAGQPEIAAQNVATLDTQASNERNVESVIDMSVLTKESPYRKVAVSATIRPDEIAADSLQSGLALISAVYRESGKAEAAADCSKVALSVEQRIKLDMTKVLEVVEAEVSANPACSCEIVKASIKASEADVALVVSIVATAINASPENMRMISQCAIASMPEAVAEVQALLARLDPNSGDSDVYSSKSSKDAKSAKVAAIVSPPSANPLDLPPCYPPIIPPPYFPPPVTNVNPCAFRH